MLCFSHCATLFFYSAVSDKNPRFKSGWHIPATQTISFCHLAEPWCFSSGLADPSFWVLKHLWHCDRWRYKCLSHRLLSHGLGSCCGLSQITWWMESGSRTSFSQEVPELATCPHRPPLCPLWAPTTEGQVVLSSQTQPPPPTCLEQV